MDSATLGFRGAVNQASDSRLNYGAGAHYARLESDVEGRFGKAIILQGACSGAERHDLGVSGGVVVANSAITGAGKNLPAVDKDRTDGHFAGLSGGSRFLKCEAHEINISVHGGVR